MKEFHIHKKSQGTYTVAKGPTHEPENWCGPHIGVAFTLIGAKRVGRKAIRNSARYWETPIVAVEKVDE